MHADDPLCLSSREDVTSDKYVTRIIVVDTQWCGSRTAHRARAARDKGRGTQKHSLHHGGLPYQSAGSPDMLRTIVKQRQAGAVPETIMTLTPAELQPMWNFIHLTHGRDTSHPVGP